ncbi:MAG: Peptidase associated domain protein [Firmicutes bacterium]|nr:Peptidase associated domain protein [Bacillota bacterium]
MDVKQGEQVCGFRLERETVLADIQSTAKEFYHEKSGARLLYMENKDDNKVFSVTFRTPPQDNNGLPHILEHSVLCGSRKYPLKEPFVELAKGSLNTYLNAMTYPDKTMYPVASRNAKDFRNLMDVYLDAVFFPNIYNGPETLMQEGWHYELDDANGEITYKGVVYNEMKGALSSPEAVLDNGIMEALFPDTAYRFESGGNPENIPELTNEQFVDFHKQYYHPSNAYLYLYGDLNIVDCLEYLDAAYLSRFSKIEVASAIGEQAPFTGKVEKTLYYPVGSQDSMVDKALLSMNFVVGKAYDAKLSLAFSILEYLLLETPAAPLKKALLEAGIGKDVKGNFADYLLQPVFEIIITGTNAEQKALFVKTATAELERLVAEGIDKTLLEACINMFEFKLREADYGSRPKGLEYNTNCLKSWLHDYSPVVHFQYTSLFTELRSALGTDYFEQLIKQYLLDNPHQAVVVLQAKPGLAEEKERAVKKELAEYKASLMQDEIARLVKTTEFFKQRQAEPDSAENLATIPLLALDDIEPQAEALPLCERMEADVPVLYHSLPTNGIVYMNLYFDARRVPQSLLPYMFLLAEIIGKVSTADYDYSELSTKINLHTGGILSQVGVYTDYKDSDVYWPKFIIKTKALEQKVSNLVELVRQIVSGSRFDNEDRLGELVREIKSRWDMTLFSRGHLLAVNRALSYFSPSAGYSEQGMLEFYGFVTDLEKYFREKSAEIRGNLAKVAELVFSKENLLASVTAEECGYELFRQAFQEKFQSLPETTLPVCQYDFASGQRNEGFMTAGKVQYVVKTANFRKLGYDYHGSLKVLETILNYDYLWTRVRVQGGAYGGFVRMECNGNVVFSSYRDPNLKETLLIFDETDEYLQVFTLSEREKLKYIIGTMSRLDAPLTAAQKGEQATVRYIRRVSQAELQQEREEVLATQTGQLNQFAPLIHKAMQQNYLCVIGSEQKVHAAQEVFKRICHLSC